MDDQPGSKDGAPPPLPEKPGLRIQTGSLAIPFP